MSPALLVLELPGRGPFQARNSPATRVPSHGTWDFGTAHALDLVPVDLRGRSAPPTWRTLLATEDPARFVGFGIDINAPVAGRVIQAHDAEPDGPARRSPLAYLAFAKGQPERIRAGLAAVAGNHVVIGTAEGPFVLVAHLRQGSLAVRIGEQVAVGQRLGACGNSGNSTQPHVHLQATDSANWQTAHAVPFVFRAFREALTGSVRHHTLPKDGDSVVSW